MDPASRLRAFEGHRIVLNSPVMPFLKLKCTHTHIYIYMGIGAISGPHGTYYYLYL